MLNEERVQNPAPFSGKAIIPFFCVRMLLPAILLLVLLVLILPFGLVILPLIAFDLVLIVAVYWYSREYFRRFLFDLRADYLFAKEGVITPGYIMVPYENIQDVHVDQGILEKALGICYVRIYTATFSAKGSQTIQGLSLLDGERFKSMLFAKIGGVRKVVD